MVCPWGGRGSTGLVGEDLLEDLLVHGTDRVFSKFIIDLLVC